MTRAASILVPAVIVCVAVPAFAQQPPAAAQQAPTPAVGQQAPAPAAVSPTRQAFQSLTPDMTREQVAKLVNSQGPMDLKQQVWGRWVPGTKPGQMEILRVHFFDNRVFWIEYDAFDDSWLREEKGGCADWVKSPINRLQEELKVKGLKIK